MNRFMRLSVAAMTALLLCSSGTVRAAPPSGMIMFFASSSCPSGWTEYTAMRGRYPVGLPASGTNLAAVGTALSNTENRAAGQHTHTTNDPGHNHSQNAHNHGVSDPGHSHSVDIGVTSKWGDGGGSMAAGGGGVTTSAATTGISVGSATATNNAATTGITINNTGSVAGTNAPYVQLIACSKD